MKHLLTTILVLGLLASAGGVEAANLITTNSGFETFTGTQDDGITDAFTGYSVVTNGAGKVEATATVHSGLSAVKLTTGTTGGVSGTIIYQGATLTAGTRYKFSFWTRGDGTTGGSYYFHASDQDIHTGSTGITGTTYTKKEIIFTSTVTGSYDFALYAGATAGDVAYFDDISIRLASEGGNTGRLTNRVTSRTLSRVGNRN